MYELLKPAIAGPGGARREKLFSRFRTTAWITGAIFTVKGKFGPPGGALLLPDAGRPLVDGYDVVREAAAVRRSIGLAGQSAAIQDELAGETRGQRLPINPFSRRGRWTTGERCWQPIETTDGVLAARRRGPAPHAGDPGLVAAS